MEQLINFQSAAIQAVLPRTHKQSAAQQARTRKRGEVNTPAWLCCKMNDFLDADWFGPKRGSPFTVELPQGWQTVPEPVPFAPGKCENSTPGWQKYVDSRRLEITCGEAPFLASRYDAATGEPIPVGQRIGILDRKLRIVCENTAMEADWLKWAFRALQSVYGYEYQGDSLLLARTNLLLTFAEYLQTRWQRSPTTGELKKAANIIAWNVFQMNGLTYTVPGGTRFQKTEQLNWFALMDGEEMPPPAVPCRVKNWRANKTQDVETIQEGSNSMKFDYVIGNPPYQDENNGELRNFAPPVYNMFLDESYKVASRVEMIHPARFLFNAGSTPKEWNQKMLADKHLKVLYYENDSSKVFPNTDIKGGLVITYRDRDKDFGAIETFTSYPEINSVLKKVKNRPDFRSLSDIVLSRTSYRLTDEMHKEHPDALAKLSKGHAYDMSSNIFQRLPEIFFDEKPDDGKEYIKILGRDGNRRVYKYIRKSYVNDVSNLNAYKVYVAQANGSGAFGEPLSSLIVEGEGVGSTETFISIGNFEKIDEANALKKYIETKFARAMLSVLKVTQNGNKPVWKMIPLQNFTTHSDIDWSKSVADIDRQLYKKYDLSADEIEFIETHVKEMA